MPIIIRENVEVNDTESDIIEEQETDKEKDRIFSVANGSEEIFVRVLGTNDHETWEERASATIAPNSAEALICGPRVCWVRLVGKTTAPGTISNVDASLVY